MATQEELMSIRNYASSLKGEERADFIKRSSGLDDAKLSVLASRLPKQEVTPVQAPIKPVMEQQNAIGATFNVPAGAIRSAIQGTGFVKGALNPSQVPSFKQKAVEMTQGIQNPVLRTVAGMGAVSLGNAADVLTNPAETLMSLPVAKLAKGAVGIAGQALKKVKLPQIINDKFLIKQAQDVKGAVDGAMSNLRGMYSKALAVEGKLAMKKDIAKLSPDVIKEFKLNTNTTVQELLEKRMEVLKQIADSSYDRPNFYKHIKPSQEALQDVAKQLKEVAIGKLTPETQATLGSIDGMYGDAITSGRKILKMVYEPSSKTNKVSGLVSMLKDKNNVGARQAFERFKQYAPELSEAEKNIASYVMREKIKDVAGKSALYLGLPAIGATAAYSLMKK